MIMVSINLMNSFICQIFEMRIYVKVPYTSFHVPNYFSVCFLSYQLYLVSIWNDTNGEHLANIVLRYTAVSAWCQTSPNTLSRRCLYQIKWAGTHVHDQSTTGRGKYLHGNKTSVFHLVFFDEQPQSPLNKAMYELNLLPWEIPVAQIASSPRIFYVFFWVVKSSSFCYYLNGHGRLRWGDTGELHWRNKDNQILWRRMKIWLVGCSSA